MKEYIKVEYPESQSFIGKPGFKKNSYLATDEDEMRTCFVDKVWYCKNSNVLRDKFIKEVRKLFTYDIECKFGCGIAILLGSNVMIAQGTIEKILKIINKIFGDISQYYYLVLARNPNKLELLINTKIKFV